MTDQFLNILKFIYKWECVYQKGHYGDMKFVTWENEDGDPGGVTKYGVDKRSHPDTDIKNLTEEQATKIYWDVYWIKNGCDKLSAGLAEAYFNCCVNAGAGRAKKILATGAHDAKSFIDGQERFYHSLVDGNSKFAKFLKGWLNRTNDLRKFLNVK
jgi:hypothetical protein